MDTQRERGNRCQKREENKKNKKELQALTGAAAGTRGWYVLDRHPPLLDKKGGDKC